MSEQDTGVMEKGYLDAEEALPEENQNQGKKKLALPKIKVPSPKNLLAKIKSLPQLFKRPKFIIISSLVILSLIILLAFFKLSSKSNYTPSVDVVELPLVSPTPNVDPEFEAIKKQVDEYNSNLGKLNTDLKDLAFPQVDLKISF